MRLTQFARYLADNDITIEQAAADLQRRGQRVSAGWIGQIRRGIATPSAALADEMVTWSGGVLTLEGLLFPARLLPGEEAEAEPVTDPGTTPDPDKIASAV